MSNFFRASRLLLAASVSLSACTHLQYFADSDHELITSASLSQVVPTQVRIVAEFSREGTPIPGASDILKREVTAALLTTSVLRPTDDPAAQAVLTVKVNDFVSTREQSNGDFVLAGITHGATSVSRITDRYEFKLRFRMAGGHERFGSDKHAIWTKVGAKPAPSLRGPYGTSRKAFNAVVADVVLTFLKNVNAASDAPESIMFTPDDSP